MYKYLECELHCDVNNQIPEIFFIPFFFVKANAFVTLLRNLMGIHLMTLSFGNTVTYNIQKRISMEDV